MLQTTSLKYLVTKTGNIQEEKTQLGLYLLQCQLYPTQALSIHYAL